MTQPRSTTRAHRRRESRNDEGIALFVILVVTIVLVVVVSQLTIQTKVEEKIADTRKGQLELVLACEASARGAMLKIYEDWEEGVNDTSAAGGQDQGGGGGGGGLPPMGDLGQVGGSDGSGGSSGYDSRFEVWAREYDENLNECDVKVDIVDGESRIDLNYLFDYVTTIEPEPEPDPNDPTGGGTGGPENPGDPTGGAGTGGDDTDDEDENGILSEEEDWTPPSEEVQERTLLFVSRTIEALVAFNQENDFDYEDNVNPDQVADFLVEYVLERKEEPETRTLRSLDAILQFDVITSELFYGPKDPNEEDEEADDDEDDDGGPSFGGGAAGAIQGYFEELGIPLEGYEELDNGELAEIPRPLGLRDLFTTHSRGVLNLNTTRPEVLIGLMVSFGDFEQAQDVAYQLNDYLNQTATPDEDDPNADPDPADSQTDPNDPGDDELDQPEFNEFRNLEDLKKVNEEWEDEEVVIEDDEIDGGSIFVVLQRDLAKVGFRSEFFMAQVEAQRNGRNMQADLILHRNLEEEEIVVVQWKYRKLEE